MSSASIKAKAKLEAVLNDPNRNDASHRTNRMMVTRDPPTGAGMANSVTRRPSQGSQSSDNGRFRSMMKNMLSRPAY